VALCRGVYHGQEGSAELLDAAAREQAGMTSRGRVRTQARPAAHLGTQNPRESLCLPVKSSDACACAADCAAGRSPFSQPRSSRGPPACHPRKEPAHASLCRMLLACMGGVEGCSHAWLGSNAALMPHGMGMLLACLLVWNSGF
jgi:hypothetical protein